MNATNPELVALLRQASPFVYRASVAAKPHEQDTPDARALMPRINDALRRAPAPELAVTPDGLRVEARAGSSSAVVAGLLRRVVRGCDIKPQHEIAVIIATLLSPPTVDTRARVWIREHVTPKWPTISGELTADAIAQAKQILDEYRDAVRPYVETRARVQVLAASLPANGFDVDLGTPIRVGPRWEGKYGWQTWREHAEVDQVHVIMATPDEQLWGLADMYGTVTMVRLLTAPHPELAGFLYNPADLLIAVQ